MDLVLVLKQARAAGWGREWGQGQAAALLLLLLVLLLGLEPEEGNNHNLTASCGITKWHDTSRSQVTKASVKRRGWRYL
jgi:hypothetical protein